MTFFLARLRHDAEEVVDEVRVVPEARAKVLRPTRNEAARHELPARVVGISPHQRSEVAVVSSKDKLNPTRFSHAQIRSRNLDRAQSSDL